MNHLGKRILACSFLTVVTGLLVASTAQAHPLGNLSINHLDALHVGASRIVDEAIVDTAEIPTAQAADQIDANRDGVTSAGELERYGVAQCEEYRRSISVTVDDRPVALTTTSTVFSYRPGQAGLMTTRLECRLEAATDLSASHRMTFSNRFAMGRVGWHEITADADASTSLDTTVPTHSVTEGLTTYPIDLLSSPADVRDATFVVGPGAHQAAQPSSTARSSSVFSRAIGPFSGAVERVNRAFDDLVGRRQLSLGVGLLAIGLALVLGASHALLPGHGKTVMAAYIAGRQGSVRDAVLVGATVTATHTGGVLVLGLALTLSSSLAGESVLAWLGVISGLIIAGLGASLLRSARRGGPTRHDHHGDHGHHHGPGHRHTHAPSALHVHDGHGHSHDGRHDHQGHGHDVRDHQHGSLGELAGSSLELVGSHRQTLLRATRVDQHVRVADDAPSLDRHVTALVAQRPAEADAGVEHRRRAEPAAGHVSRRGLVGMGIAGGLVPSPSALVVLLSAIALGRTVFGVVLVIAYGAGMAGTLTLAGVLLVRVRDRRRSRRSAEPHRLRSFAARWMVLAPYLTAALVTVVGLGLAARSLGSV
jgi:ABC-type nickel/cobalt efflux system permease component RcnA